MEDQRNRRLHPRYAVSDLTCMKARIDRSSPAEQILTLGAGGCGFVGFDRLWQKSEIKRVTSVFELSLAERIGPITIQGTIVYIKPVQVSGRSLYYFGIQFMQDVHRIQPVIEALEELQIKGEVRLAGG